MRTKAPLLLGGAVFGLLALAAGCGGKVTGYDPRDDDGEGRTGTVAGVGGVAGTAGGVGDASAGWGPAEAGADSDSGYSGAGGIGGADAGAGSVGEGGSNACWDYLAPSTNCRSCLDSVCCWEVIHCFQDPDGFCATAFECFEDCPDGDFFSCPGSCGGISNNMQYWELLECGLMNCYDDCIGAP